MFAWGPGNHTTLSIFKQIQTYHATIIQKIVIHRPSPETSNHSELCRNDPRVRVLNKQSTESFCTIPIQEIRQTTKTLISHTEKSSQIKLCQTQTNKIQHNTTTSLIQHADIKDNYLFWTYQATILKNTSKSYLERKVTQDARSWKCPQRFQVHNANQLTELQVQISIYCRCKVRRTTCKLTSISRRHGIFILIQAIIHL